MRLIDVNISAQETYAPASREWPVEGGRKYAVRFEAAGIEGLPLSGYLAAIMLDETHREITRKVRWLNDFSGEVVTYNLVFKVEANARSLLLAYRINCEWGIKAAWRGKLTDPNDMKPEAVRDGAEERFDDLLASRAMIEAAELARADLRSEGLHMDVTPDEIEIIRAVKPYTLTSNERLLVLMHAVNYVVDHDIPGAVVECGVWKGGSMMAAAMALLKRGALRGSASSTRSPA